MKTPPVSEVMNTNISFVERMLLKMLKSKPVKRKRKVLK